MMLESNLTFSENRLIEKAYIITMLDNNISLDLAKRCLKSCEDKGQNAVFWPAFEGTKNGIKVPKFLSRQDWVSWIKVPSNLYSNSQIACFFSHVSLWAYCAKTDKPLIILEHDAICSSPLREHGFYNCIQYLGNREQKNGRHMTTIPPHASMFDARWRSLCRAHAYAIDPSISRNLLSYVIREGMTKTLDMFIRADIFAMIQNGIYFYDEPGVSTIAEPENSNGDK